MGIIIVAIGLFFGANILAHSKVGPKLGDVTYYHKPHCKDPYILEVPDETIQANIPGRGDFTPGGATHVEHTGTHKHYYC